MSTIARTGPEGRSIIGRASAAMALVVAMVLSAPGSAMADSEMHQSPELFRGSPETCRAIKSGRVQRGSYPWQPSCDDATPSEPGRSAR